MEPGLYAIVDIDALAGRDPVVFAQRVLAGGRLAGLQLRAKSLGAGAMVSLARELGPWCRAAGVEFFVNDRPDVAIVAGADGVHLGTEDLPVEAARRVSLMLKVGLSSHNEDEVRRALETDADYIAFGPVFGTKSKENPAPMVGIEALTDVCKKCEGRAVVAIGGITVQNASAVRAAGARAGAVIAGLLVEDARVTEVASALHHALGGR